MKKAITSTIFKLILLTIILIALYLEIYVNGTIVMGAFFYFTIQSNILAALCLLLFIFLPPKSRAKCLIRGIALLSITLTGLVYNFVLYKIFLDWGGGAYTFSRTVTHVAAPLGFIFDWLIFDKHNMMKIKHIFIWLSYPIAYCLISLYANLRYDFSLYFFLNLSGGYSNPLKWLSIFLGLLLIIGFIIVGLDKIIGRRNKGVLQNTSP